MMSALPQDPERKMDFWYSCKKWKDVLGADEAETICVPPCLDILKSWKRNDLDKAPQLAPSISGQKGEAAFMLKFQELNMGGILVSGLQFHELEGSRAVPKTIFQYGEWDAIYFHEVRGIYVIEVKATETNDENIVKKQIEKAKTQLDRNIKSIKQSFLSLNLKECTCITGFICFPFRNEDRRTYEGYRIIDKSTLNDRATFKKFFEPQTNEMMTEVSLLRSFVAEFVCCRSQVEFHSQSYNAMRVATWIMEQDIAQKQDPTKLVNMPGNGPSGRIILTAKQLKIVECREKCLTIRGAPGSGKTLILMLRALKAAMENKIGSVFVFVNEKLKAKYEHFFYEERDKIFVDYDSNIDRTPKVHTIDKIFFAQPEDDIFFDETLVEDSYIEMIKSRMDCSGGTTVVFTGLHKPGEAVASFLPYRRRLKQFKHFRLKKVLRGTENIFEKWKEYYPLGYIMGHSIYGVAVKNETFDSFERVQNEIANRILTLKNANISNTTFPSMKNQHIAVITCDYNDSIEMRSYFKTKDILCGQVNEQARKLKDASIVAVDVYLNTPSYEWPIVFIAMKPGFTENEVLPIAASRCIASLAIFTYKNLQLKSSESVATQESTNALKKSLRESYSTRFQRVYPFSLPFTFDVENTWVSLALKEEENDSRATEDHAELLKRAFKRVKMLIIEGDPATGKTSLMQRLAYEWAKGKKELLYYDLVLYAEFREVREKTFQSIADLVLYYSKNYLTKEGYENLKKLVNNKQFCKMYRILVLLDGYNESSLEEQCSEFSSYMKDKAVKKRLFFDTVITTRKGYLSDLRGREGRFVFAEALGFTTEIQKEKYISNHFLSSEIDNKRKIAAVHNLLNNNENLNKLAKTPLFLTFICLVHETIIDGTLLELYCNIIWWLIDRHQQDFPDHDIPNLFGFQNGSSDKFETIQDHYLNFPQLHCLGKMALRKLKKNVFKPSDCAQFNLQPIIEQVGLLRKEKKHDNSLKLETSFFFPHRTIQEFLAAFYCLCSNDSTSKWLLPNFILNTSELEMNEFEGFLFRIALSDKMPIQTEKCKYYFERISEMTLDIAFNTRAGFDTKLLNWFLSQCKNVQSITLNGEQNCARRARHMLNDTSINNNESNITSNMCYPTLFSFNDLIKLYSLKFQECTFELNSQLSFTNCPSLKNLTFSECKNESNTILNIATLPAIDAVVFEECIYAASFQLSFSNCQSSKSLKINHCKIESSIILALETLPATDTVEFFQCIFKANSQLSFTNCQSLKNLKISQCEINSSTLLCLAPLPVIDTVEFSICKIDMPAWQSITDAIWKNSVKQLKLTFGTDIAKNKISFGMNGMMNKLLIGDDYNKEFVIHLQKCKNVVEMEITIQNCKIRQNDLLLFSDLDKLHSMIFQHCTFEANSQLSYANCTSLKNLEFKKCTNEANSLLSFTNCPSLKNLTFTECKNESNAILNIATLPATDTVEFFQCTFKANSQLSLTNCQSLKILKFIRCGINNSTNLGIATLSAINTVEFSFCKINLAQWQLITDEISNSSAKCLKLTFGTDVVKNRISFGMNGTMNKLLFGDDYNKEFFIHLLKCKNVVEMEITIRNCKIRQNDLLSLSDLDKLHSMIFQHCTFEANSQLSFTNCTSLKILKFIRCRINNSTNLGIATLSAIDTVEFSFCKVDLAPWQLITDEISKSSVKCLIVAFGEDFNKEFLIHLQKCNNVEQMEITIWKIKIFQNNLSSFSDLTNLHSVSFNECTFEANSQLLFTNCPSLNNIKFKKCIMEYSTNIDIAALPAIETVEFYWNKIDLASWQLIADAIRNSSAKFLKLSVDYFAKEIYPGFLHHLQECERIEEIHVMDVLDSDGHDFILDRYEEEVIAALAQLAQKLPRLGSITIDTNGRRLNERNKEQIEKAGQESNPDFLIKYAERGDPEL